MNHPHPTRPPRRRSLLQAVAAIGLAMAGADLAAQTAGTFPNRAVRLVVPYPAGSQVDAAARILAKEFGDALGQGFVVDNKPGASTIIGAEFVAKSAPDGYTLLVTTNTTSAANRSLFKTLPYDSLKDFAHVGRVVATSLVLVGRTDLPGSNLKDFLAQAKARKQQLSIGYFSAGSQVAAANLKNAAGIDLLMVPYKGSPPAVTDVMGGQADLLFTDFTTALPQLKAGKLKGLAVTSEKRSLLAPELPAMAEELPGYAVTTWIGLVAPTGTPPAIVNRINAVLNAALAKPEIKARFADMGFEPAPMSPAEFAKYVESEIETWRKHVADAGIPAQ